MAVCEESEEEPRPGHAAAVPGSGGIRQRDVVRTLTPGTVTDPRLLREDRPTYLVAIAPLEERLGLAWTDVAAGEFKAAELDLDEAAAELQRLEPAEVIVPVDRPVPEALVARRPVTPVGPSESAVGRLQRAFPEADLSELPAAEIAAGLIVGYLEETQGAEVPVLDAPTTATPDEVMRLDAVTQRHLELVETERGRERAGSLLGTLDRTVTPMGRRMLRGWLLRPLVNPRTIAVRQQIVAELVADDAAAGGPGRAPRRRGRPGAAGRPGERPSGQPGRPAGARRGGHGARRSWRGRRPAARSPFLRALGRPRPALAAVRRAGRRCPDAAPVTVLPRQGAGTGRSAPSASPDLAEALGRLDRARAWQGTYVERLRRQPGARAGQAGAEQHPGPVSGGAAQHARAGRVDPARRAPEGRALLDAPS